MSNYRKLLVSAAAGVLLNLAPNLANAAAIISNGTVQLGVNDTAELNVGGGTPSSGGTTFVGLRYVPTNGEATAPGCLCEGWGAGDRLTGVSGYANRAVDGIQNLGVVSFSSTASTARSVVNVGSTLQVTHDYHPSTNTANLYEVTVTIKNISGSTVAPSYRRVMDWDAEPTAFNEYVTINAGAAAALKFDSNNGFESANPFAARSNLGFIGSFVDAGPNDHGALFDFEFANLAPGASTSFNIYYGAAGNETGANTAVGAVAAEVFSYGQPSSSAPTDGSPNTYIFAFKGVGGAPIACGEPDPATGLERLTNCFFKSDGTKGITVGSTSYNSTPAGPDAPAGVFTVNGSYCNQAMANLTTVESRTKALTNGNKLISRTSDGPDAANPAGAGSRQAFPLAGSYADGILGAATAMGAGECAVVVHRVGLRTKAAFTYTVEVIGFAP